MNNFKLNTIALTESERVIFARILRRTCIYFEITDTGDIDFYCDDDTRADLLAMLVTATGAHLIGGGC